MKISIPRKNWHMEMADAIEKASPGDTIMVHTDAMKEMAQHAHSRMCPDKPLYFELESRRAQ